MAHLIENFGSEEVLELWGGRERAAHFPLCEPLKLSLVSSAEIRERSRWFQQWFKPQGIIDAVGIPVVRSPTMLGTFGFARHELIGEIGEAEMSGLRLIAPHVRRAVTISSRLFEFETINPPRSLPSSKLLRLA